ncbi:MAG TPA: serine/threonine-protein kinase [Phycisphaerales bacterium]|nr:serine/threonine-protein kinase [Phycisphaerales bacterium]
MPHEEDPTIDPHRSQPERPATGSLVGQRLGVYRVQSLLGEGGFGSVYLAEQAEPVRRRVALKVIRPGMDSRAVVARFEAERQALALMDHPGVAKVFDAGVTPEGRPYFVMELVRGEPIDRFCESAGLDLHDRVRLIVQVAEAVHHAHMKGVVHRDLKPSNILVEQVDKRAVAKIIDFGVAKALTQRLTETTLYTERGQMIGTPEYMAPEQARGDVLDVDTRADVYSLGAILYQLLTGETPIDSRRLRSAGFAEIPTLIEQIEPVRPSERVTKSVRAGHATVGAAAAPATFSRRLRGDLDWILMRCLEKDRARRYDSASAFAADLERYLHDEPVEAGPPSAAYRMQKFVRRHRGLVAGLSAVAAALVLGIVGTSLGLGWALRERDRARVAEQVAQERAGEALAARDESEAVTEFLIGAIESVEPGEGRRDVTMHEVLDAAAEAVGASFASSPGLEARIRHTLGNAFSALGDLTEADRQLPVAYDLRRRTLGDDHPETLRVLGNLASLRQAQGRLAEAEQLGTRAIETYRRIGQQEAPAALGVMNNLAQVYRDLGRTREAIELQQETLYAQERVLGSDHPHTLGSMVNLAAMLGGGGDFARAEELLLTVAEAWRARSGEEHPDTLLVLHNLGILYETAGRLEEAEAVQRRVLGTRERILGEAHPDTIGAMINLGLTLRRLERTDEAEQLYTRAVEAGRGSLGESHPITLEGAQNLIGLYEALGWPERAFPVVERTLGILRGVADNPHASARQLNDCAWLLLTAEPESARDPGAALALALRACEVERRAGGGDLWMYLDSLALAHHLCRNAAGAVAAQREAIALLPPEGEAYRGEMSARLAEYEAAAGAAQGGAGAGGP